MKQISIEYPERLAFSLKMKKKEFQDEIKIISLVKLYELGKISSGIAADLLSISRVEFLELLKNIMYPIFTMDMRMNSNQI